MATEEVRSVQVDFAGLMQVVGKNLYSTPVVANNTLYVMCMTHLYAFEF